MLQGRPVYRFGGNRAQTIVFADNGDVFAGIGGTRRAQVARRYAPHHTGRSDTPGT